MANQFLSLSLFLMLLSFFIVMNSISNFEDNKAQPVLNSLTQAFSGAPPEYQAAPNPVPNEYQEVKQGDTLEALEGLFNAHIAGFEAKRNRLGTVMHVKLPVARFENALDFDGYEDFRIPTGEHGSFIQTLITLLRSENKGQRYRLDMIYNVGNDPIIYAEKDPDNFLKDIQRVSALATGLERSGAPKKLMSVGLKKGNIGSIDIYFNRYHPFTLEGHDSSKSKAEASTTAPTAPKLEAVE